jgi:hypothetical protein
VTTYYRGGEKMIICGDDGNGQSLFIGMRLVGRQVRSGDQVID